MLKQTTISKTNEKTTQKVEVEKKHVKIKQGLQSQQTTDNSYTKNQHQNLLLTERNQIQQRVVGAFKPKPVLNKTPATPKTTRKKT